MIEKFTISRRDEDHECFPSMTRLRSGRIILVYRESEGHVGREYCRLIVRTSDDDGKTFSDRRVLVETKQVGGVIQKYNCPKVQQLKDDQVLLLCDAFPVPLGPDDDRLWYSRVEFFMSGDNGETWDGPKATTVSGIVPDEVVELEDGVCLLATHTRGVQYVSRSEDGGAHWSDPILVARKEGYALCEASIIQAPNGELICYMRENTDRGRPVHKSFSKDGGLTWEGPYETLICSGHRTVAHITQSGNVMMTYRYFPGGVTSTGRRQRFKNLFAYIEPIESALERDRSKQSGITMALDHDRSDSADTGYTGWAETQPGEFLVANYIVDDAPKAQIRGYRFKESDF